MYSNNYPTEMNEKHKQLPYSNGTTQKIRSESRKKSALNKIDKILK